MDVPIDLAPLVAEVDAALAQLGHQYTTERDSEDIRKGRPGRWRVDQSRVAALLRHLTGWRELEPEAARRACYDEAITALCRLWIALPAEPRPVEGGLLIPRDPVRPFAAVMLAPRGDGFFAGIGAKKWDGMFGLLGGKLEPGETALEAAVREAEEEGGVRVRAEDAVSLGVWEDEDGHLTECFLARRYLLAEPEKLRGSAEGHALWVAGDVLRTPHARFPSWNCRALDAYERFSAQDADIAMIECKICGRATQQNPSGRCDQCLYG